MLTLSHIVSLLASSAIYACFLGGLLLLSRETLRRLGDIVGARRRLRRIASPVRAGGSALFVHLRTLLDTLAMERIGTGTFLMITAGIFLTVFAAAVYRIGSYTAFCLSALLALMPYFFLRVRLEKKRRLAGGEGEMMLSAFLTSYLVSGGNVYESAERTLRSCSHLPATAALMTRLLSGLRTTGNPALIRKASREFAYGIGTSWSRTFAFVIEESAVSGRNMTPAIEDIIAQLKEARALAEERKRLNGESARLAVWLTPGIYLLSLLGAVFVIGVSSVELLQNQFFTPVGFTLFAAGVFVYLVNRMLLELCMNGKLDF